MANLFRTILVPHDFSTHSTEALRVAVDLAAAHKGRVVVLHVIAPFYPPEGVVVWIPDIDLIKDARRNLEADIAKVVGKRRVPVERRVVIGAVLERVLDAARGADAIVMATLGRTGLPHLVMGSVAEKVVRHSPVPVLTIRPKGVRRVPWRRRRSRKAA